MALFTQSGNAYIERPITFIQTSAPKTLISPSHRLPHPPRLVSCVPTSPVSIKYLPSYPLYGVFHGNGFGRRMGFFGSLFVLWTFFGYVVAPAGKAKQARLASEEQTRQLELKVQALELERIQYKLNPHLFKNALNSIQSHAYQTYRWADNARQCPGLYRAQRESDRQFVTLKEELGFFAGLHRDQPAKTEPAVRLAW